MIYCHDTKSGDVIWEYELPAGIEARKTMETWKADETRFDDLRTKWTKGKIRVLAMKSHHNAARTRSPVHIGGVLVVHDFVGGLVGLDAVTGKPMWHHKGGLGGTGSTPVPLGDDAVLAGHKPVSSASTCAAANDAG